MYEINLWDNNPHRLCTEKFCSVRLNSSNPIVGRVSWGQVGLGQILKYCTFSELLAVAAKIPLRSIIWASGREWNTIATGAINRQLLYCSGQVRLGFKPARIKIICLPWHCSHETGWAVFCCTGQLFLPKIAVLDHFFVTSRWILISLCTIQLPAANMLRGIAHRLLPALLASSAGH